MTRGKHLTNTSNGWSVAWIIQRWWYDLRSSSERQFAGRRSSCGSSCQPGSCLGPRRNHTRPRCSGRPVPPSRRTALRRILNTHVINVRSSQGGGVFTRLAASRNVTVSRPSVCLSHRHTDMGQHATRPEYISAWQYRRTDKLVGTDHFSGSDRANGLIWRIQHSTAVATVG